ncbi:MAG: tRNA (adenosine(37)-N6)-dimethylallyltransferase MiaA [Nitrospirota bacterium]|nr:MAG: tRNA (adenosine(37)-N6)-dimethylallyltransferase MiaA [Nitrospirota bacterium]
MKTQKPLVAIVGPTAIGKSRIGIEIAKVLHTEILTADSCQVYRGMDIGTDKPTLPERQGIPHRLIDLVPPDQSFNVGDFRRHALQEISRLHSVGFLPLIVGGTGLYIRSLLRGLCPGPPANWPLRKALTQEATKRGWPFLHEKLQQVDPDLARRLHPNDQPKVLRALEVYQTLGIPFSKVQQQHQFQETPYPYLLIGLTMERQTLYRRIETRVDWEIEKGLVQETQQLMQRGYSRNLGSMKGLGYRQFSGYLAREYSYEEAVRLLKRDTRHFAKRQMTWFRKEPGIHWITLEESDIPERAATRVLKTIDDFLCTFKTSQAIPNRTKIYRTENAPEETGQARCS